MTNINHEYPEYVRDDKLATLRHYQQQLLLAVESEMHQLTDQELAARCLDHSTGFPLIQELSRRLQASSFLIRDAIREQQK